MKRFFHLFLLLALYLVSSCSKEKQVAQQTKKKQTKQELIYPFTRINLKDLSAFKPTGANWKTVGDVVVNRNKKRTISSKEGGGILVNTNDQKKNQNLFTAFEHKDIELELDVMMPVQSNSGIYFQSRYEIQLLDSWNVKQPKSGDIGGIYQRWDKTAEKGKQGYEGHAPRINAAKAPGLWQHLRVIFHAPRFDANGKKIKNAWFEEVYLNGVLLHKNVEVTGPTRAGLSGEKATAPIMIQGDHGPVAFKNIKYRLFNGGKITFSNLVRREYTAVKNLEELKSKTPVLEEKTAVFYVDKNPKEKVNKVITYTGTIHIPETGKYLFETKPGKGIVEIHIEGQKTYKLNKSGKRYFKKVFNLKKGAKKFKFIYNQNQGKRNWLGSFNAYVEGTKVQRQALQDGVDPNAEKFDPLKGIIIQPKEHALTQRSFITHKGIARTHCISVGTTEGTHFSYDLATGSLLKVWNGDFLNTTHMWLSRGTKQLGEPIGFSVTMHGDLEFAALENENTAWPLPLPENQSVKQLGYEFDIHRMPTFTYETEGAIISNSFATSKVKREVKRNIDIETPKELWHKIADGENIKELSNQTYIINTESYYIDFSGNKENLKPIIRTSNGKQELLVKVPVGQNNINYTIIW
ncbi:family 16 glycoside hydrolase [Wenyingzhuangia sp. IMCC45574]